MSTEYRRGIPSTAHVEAATRLGLSWQQADAEWREWCFEVRGRDIWCDFAPWDARGLACLTEDNRVMSPARAMSASWRPIRPDGTLVDWEVLDQEVARVAAPAQPREPQGFRADLWRRMCQHFSFVSYDGDEVTGLSEISNIDGVGIHSQYWQWGWGTADREAPTQQQRTDILARWTVYQELKPLYDLVDGAQGEAAMPRDVYNECRARAGWTGEADDRWLLRYNSRLEAVGIGEVWHGDGRTSFERANMCNFAAVLDAVAERRVAERMRGQAQAHTVTSAQPEPRRFADVRPDRHGWRWWRMWGSGCIPTGSSIECQPDLGWRIKSNGMHTFDWNVPNSSDADRTVIPTDEQGNPVSWESIGQSARDASDSASRPGITASFNNVPLNAQPLTQEGFRRALASLSDVPLDTRQIHTDTLNYVNAEISRAIIGSSPTSAELPRFTADELDDVDHSKTTKLDEVTLRRGKLPTVEQIAKYREVRARRTGGSVAEALKESRIDCEVAQYVLERWAGGLGDADTVLLLRAAGCIAPLKDAPRYSIRAFDPKQSEVDRRSQDFLRTHNATLDTSEKPSPTIQRERQEAEERRQRLAELRQRLSAERAAQPQEMAKESETFRFNLIEPDPQADPTASIRAWEARQAAAKVRPAAAPARPAAVPRRPAIEVVDAEVDGLSRSEAFAALFGRALNGGC